MTVHGLDSYGSLMATAELSNTETIDAITVEAFNEQLLGHFTSSFVTHMVDIGHRTGLFDALGQGPTTSAELARRAGLHERYVREWLGAIVTSGIANYESTTEVYSLPPEHRVSLSGDTAHNVAAFSQLSGLLARHIPAVTRAFREGGGVPYSDYRPEFTDVMDALGRATYDALLVDTIVPLAGDLDERLAQGIRVADIGCGTGHTTNLLASAYPRSTFIGYDIATDAIDNARREAAECELTNVTFEIHDVARLPTTPSFGAVFAFDAIHDQTDPARVLQQVHDSLDPDGTFAMFDIRASSHLECNLDNPLAPMLYAISTLHCTPISLADDGAGLGTVWGQELAKRMLRQAGFVDVNVYDVPNDPFDCLYVSHRAHD